MENKEDYKGELLVDDSIPVADRARATDKFNDFKV